MSIWSRLIGIGKDEDTNHVINNKNTSVPFDVIRYAIVDVEIGLKDHKIHDIGALRHDGATFHKSSNFLVIQTISADIISSIMMQSICLPIKHSTASLSIHFMYHLYYFRNALIISL